MQIRKTYRGINSGMLYNEIRDLAHKEGIMTREAKVETYPLPSGATQSRAIIVFQTDEEKGCGSAHIISSPGGNTRILLDLDENLIPRENITTLQENLDFILGSYEIKW